MFYLFTQTYFLSTTDILTTLFVETVYLIIVPSGDLSLSSGHFFYIISQQR